MEDNTKILDNDAKVSNDRVGTDSTTTVINDTISQKYEFPNHVQLSADLIKSQVVTSIQDIKQFLKRPVLLRSGTWTTSTSGTFIAVDMPFEALNNTIYTPKVQGFLNFRATAVMTLQVNANRFCQGRLIMHFLPQAQVPGSFPSNRNAHLVLKTQQPNVQLDANTESEAQLVIPYMSPKLYYDLNTGDGEMGAVYVSVYSPLAYGVGGANADYSLWVHFEDVELEIPTLPTSFLTQSLIKGKKKSKSKDKDVTDVENEQGPVANMSRVIGDTAGTIASLHIPVVSDIAGTVSWVSDAVNSVASFFGFSNPRSEMTMEPYKKSVFTHHQHSDVGTHDEILSYSVRNKLEKLPGLGPTDLDEATFAYILSKNVYFDKFTWAATDVYNDTLFDVDITNSSFLQTASITDGVSTWRVAYYTPVGFFMNYFRYHRGSVKLTLKFVKTEFHTGRVVCSYLPHPNGAAPGTLAVNDTNYLLREIVDLRESNEVSFILPYTHNNPWIDGDDLLGSFYVHVLNPLVAPDGASSSIDVLVEISAGPDFEVAGFSAPLTEYKFTPVVSDNTAFATQSGLPQQTKLNDKDNVIGNASLPVTNYAPDKYVMGEKLVSVYNVIKRAQYMKEYAAVASNFHSCSPFEIGSMGRGISASAFSISSGTGDPLSLFSSFYAYNRGSCGYRVMPGIENSNRSIFRSFMYQVVNNAVFNNTNLIIPTHSSVIAQDTTTDAGACVSLAPYMELSARLARLNTADRNNYATYAPPIDEYSSPYGIGVLSSLSSSSYFKYRFAGDDYQVGFFIGIPPLFDADLT